VAAPERRAVDYMNAALMPVMMNYTPMEKEPERCGSDRDQKRVRVGGGPPNGTYYL
jgi:hypothetical protein